jgi:drug/metabolite transporter (DMT)-like permease
MNPVMGVLLSALFLRESREALQWTTLFALLFVSLGIWIGEGNQEK